MELTLLGTACATAGADRDNTYLLLREKGETIMIDVGGNPLSKLKKLAVSPLSINKIIFTHFHIDHIYGLPSLLWGMWLENRTDPLTIICPTVNQQQLEQWVDVMNVSEWPILFDMIVETYDVDKEQTLVETESISISNFPCLHIGPTSGLSIKYQNKHLVYSCDTKLNPWIKRQSHIDLLIHEATTAIDAAPNHSSLKDVLQFYDMNAIKELVAVHLTDGEPYEEVLQEVDKELAAKVTIGNDLLTITI